MGEKKDLGNNEKVTLEKLLEQCDPENRHEEVDFSICGKELI